MRLHRYRRAFRLLSDCFLADAICCFDRWYPSQWHIDCVFLHMLRQIIVQRIVFKQSTYQIGFPSSFENMRFVAFRTGSLKFITVKQIANFADNYIVSFLIINSCRETLTNRSHMRSTNGKYASVNSSTEMGLCKSRSAYPLMVCVIFRTPGVSFSLIVIIQER